jgi:hypothetical protein
LAWQSDKIFAVHRPASLELASTRLRQRLAIKLIEVHPANGATES